MVHCKYHFAFSRNLWSEQEKEVSEACICTCTFYLSTWRHEYNIVNKTSAVEKKKRNGENIVT